MQFEDVRSQSTYYANIYYTNEQQYLATAGKY